MDKFQNEINIKEWENPDNWSCSDIYFSKKDTRLIVSKKHKWMGWTINFGHNKAIYILILLFIFLSLFPVFLIELLNTNCRL